jgi:hypothetical protein
VFTTHNTGSFSGLLLLFAAKIAPASVAASQNSVSSSSDTTSVQHADLAVAVRKAALCVADRILLRALLGPIRLHARRFIALPAAAVWSDYEDRRRLRVHPRLPIPEAELATDEGEDNEKQESER